MYGYNILYIKKISIYIHYTLLITSKAYSHAGYSQTPRRLQPNATQVTAKRHYRCALLMLPFGCICGMITAQPHYRSAVTTLAFSLNDSILSAVAIRWQSDT